MRSRQVECVIFKKNEGIIEFLLLHRIPEKGGFWQPVSGGLEDDTETVKDGALREVYEETGITIKDITRIIENVHEFTIDKHYLTGEPIPRITEYVLGIETKNEIVINIENNIVKEHREYRWVHFDEAIKLLKWQNNKDAFLKLINLIQ